MSAILHCIVTNIENNRLREQLLVWHEKANADPLIQKIRVLRDKVEELTLSENRENCLAYGISEELASWGEECINNVPDGTIPQWLLDNWNESYIKWLELGI
tara:strand:+ start:40 stop:345 length:306 start_codon:yes stop_codon:yes gene_type:complete